MHKSQAHPACHHIPAGPPSATNSHPHVSGANGEFVVVHNGIITNYAVLKPFLVRIAF